MAKKKRSLSIGTSDVPLSAMIDVTFLLLIYFISTQSESTDTAYVGINSAAPSKAPPPPQRPPTMDIFVLSTGYNYQGTNYTLETLEPFVTQYVANCPDQEHPDIVVNLKLSNTAVTKDLVYLLDMLVKYKVEKINTFWLRDGANN